MPADLPPEEFVTTATLMLRLHADFRQRHGFPPLRNAWTLVEDLETLKNGSPVNEPRVLASPRPVIGPVLEMIRGLLWKVLKPVFDRQAEVNRDVIRALEELVRDRQQHRYEYHALSLRIAALEMAVARLEERDE